MSEIIVSCPHCQEYIVIEKLNCGIFRHGIFKHDKTQIPPHSDKKLCDSYVEQNMIYGCGRPFQILIENNKINVIICDYI